MKLDKSLAMVAMMASGSAFASGEECTTSADCAAGEQCLPAPCLPPECDPADPTCEVPACPSFCIADGSADGSGGSDGANPDDPAPSGECVTDADCSAGLSCQSAWTDAVSCVCSDGGSDCGCEGLPTDPIEYKTCLPKTGCTTDADCGDGLECPSIQAPCAAPAMACAEGAECPEPEPCTPETYTVCQPKWAGTCEADADCGEGFTCKAYESCSCSGGGSTGSAGGDPGAPSGGASDSEGAAPPPDDEEPTDTCSCEPSAEKYCEPQKTTCTADADCVAGWTCMTFDGAVSSGGSATDTACAEGEPCETTPVDPQPAAPPPPESWCVPPFYSDFASAGGLPESGPMADGVAFPSTGETAGGNNQGNDGGDGGGEVVTDTGTETTKDASNSKSASAGCTVDGRGNPASLATIVLALLAAWGLRRRA